MGIEETLKKYEWMIPIIEKADRETKRLLMKNFRLKRKNFYPSEGEYKADVDNLIKCMLCPNMCRFDCGTLQAAGTETMSPAYKARIGYYLTMGMIDPAKEENQAFIDLMYKCSNEENCKVWCPFEFSVVSLLETVRDDLNDKGLMPDYCKEPIKKLNNSNTIEGYNIFETYKEKGIENIETDGNDEVFYYIGCESMKFPDVINANIAILKKAGIKFSTNLEQKGCCGGPAFNIRDMETAKKFASKNKDLIEKTGAKVVVSDCPGCIETLKARYKKAGIEIKTRFIHVIEYIKELVENGKLQFNEEARLNYKKVTIHDPCLLARNLNDTESIRYLLSKIPGIEIAEPIYNKEYTHCCGWSGTVHWADREIAITEAKNRINELKETGSNVIVSACPECELGLAYGIEDEDKVKIKIIDISELLVKLL
ncbi:MAG: (Fe-S)-binding protein [Promethearchaeota archaeon]|nr:MAG: (Fe-S)-binding protein [Candidatus Lokiarchaeota archaeon]